MHSLLIGLHFFLIINKLQCLALELYEGELCENDNGRPGTCKPIDACQEADDAIAKKKYHDFTRCGFDGFIEIVCCPEAVGTRSAALFNKTRTACDRYNKDFPITISYHIVGGENAEPGEFPHMAALGFYNDGEKLYLFNCGGTLISERYILTAAHCIINVQKTTLKIARLGEIDVPDSVKTPDPKMDHNVVNFTIHPEYNWKQKFNDIALVKLEKIVTFTNMVRPACLHTHTEDPNRMIITGWGVVKLGGDRSNILQKAVLAPSNLQECNSTYKGRTNNQLTERQICAASLRSDACQGDSGGPLQIQGNLSVLTVVGITSYGIGCGSKHPGVYTKVYSYVEWIENIIWP